MSKTPISRQAYINAAFDIINDVGVDKLSMRKVASRLGVSPMAMYKYFPNKDDLLAATLEEVIARADVFPSDDLAWPEWVEHVGRGMYNSLCEEASWVPLLGSLRLGSQGAAVTDAFVKKLTAAGFTIEQSVRAYFAVIQIVIGAVCLRSSLSLEKRLQEAGCGSLEPVTLSYLEKVDNERLKIAPSLDAILKLDQLSIGLPLLIESLGAQLKLHQKHAAI